MKETEIQKANCIVKCRANRIKYHTGNIEMIQVKIFISYHHVKRVLYYVNFD